MASPILYILFYVEIIAEKIKPDFIMLPETHVTEKMYEYETELGL